MHDDDFKNFLLIKQIKEEKDKRDIFSLLLKNKFIFLFIILFFIILIIIYKIYFTNINLLENSLKDNLFQINNGESITFISQKLEDEKIIKSATAFKIYMKICSKNEVAQAGIYRLEKKDNLVSLGNKIIKGNYAIPPVKITIPEGTNNQKLAEILSKSFKSEINSSQLVDDFGEKNILEKIKNKEGYLFPETYSFLPNSSLSQVVNQLENSFYFNLKKLFMEEGKGLNIHSLDMKDFKVADYFNDEDKTINLKKRFTIISEVGTTTVTIKDIITMASYLEGEANNEKDMKIVAGVLWTRLKMNFPLQIDAATSTYKSKGFTDSPINNPGLIAIRSAINPTNLGYIYYITGNDGNMYYAKDYKTHLDNINKYLRDRR